VLEPLKINCTAADFEDYLAKKAEAQAKAKEPVVAATNEPPASSSQSAPVGPRDPMVLGKVDTNKNAISIPPLASLLYRRTEGGKDGRTFKELFGASRTKVFITINHETVTSPSGVSQIRPIEIFVNGTDNASTVSDTALALLLTAVLRSDLNNFKLGIHSEPNLAFALEALKELRQDGAGALDPNRHVYIGSREALIAWTLDEEARRLRKLTTSSETTARPNIETDVQWLSDEEASALADGAVSEHMVLTTVHSDRYEGIPQRLANQPKTFAAAASSGMSCGKCTGEVVKLDGCLTCLSCGLSKCG
jgi:hypothetical protein